MYNNLTERFPQDDSETSTALNLCTLYSKGGTVDVANFVRNKQIPIHAIVQSRN